MKKNRIIALAAALVLSATAVIGGTMAYFTDTADTKNTFTVGNVKIELHESNGLLGKDHAVDDAYREVWLPEHPLMPTDPSDTNNDNVLGKEVTVKNIGASKAYLWTEVWIPEELDAGDTKNLHLDYADGVEVTAIEEKKDVEGVTYNGYKVYAENGPVIEKGAITQVLLKSVYMDKGVTQCTEEHGNCYVLNNGEHYNGSWELLVYAFGIQADGFANMDEAMTAYYAQ